MKRRQFLTWSLIFTGSSLAGISFWQKFSEVEIDQALKFDDLTFLNDDDAVVIAALTPVFLGEQHPQIKDSANLDFIRSVIRNIDEAVIRLPQRTQNELRELFLTLTLMWGRLLLAGLWAHWSKAEAAQLNEFLQSWRESSLGLLQQGYLGLHQLIVGSAYGEPQSWLQTGYQGPPELT